MTAPTTVPVAASGHSAIDVARSAAREAGRRARARFRQPQQITVKGRGNLLTDTDLELERYLTETLLEEFRGHKVLSEETASGTATSGWVWVVDPLDGTRNFVSGIPFFCINVALCCDGEPVVAVTHDPNHDESFWAERGGGAWVNDQPVHVSQAPSVQQSVLGIDLGYDDPRGKVLLHLAHELFPGAQSLRIPGSAALGLAYAACGRYDLFIHHHLYPWDIAAGILLVREAGGVITSHLGGPVTIASRTVIAGGAAAHGDFLRWQEAHAAELSLPPEG
jgi:fructose-1,6-bisphosphatase/inositol monophosphatase family enzyme